MHSEADSRSPSRQSKHVPSNDSSDLDDKIKNGLIYLFCNAAITLGVRALIAFLGQPVLAY